MDISKLTYALAAAAEALYQITLISHGREADSHTVGGLLKGVLRTESALSTSIYPMEILRHGLQYFSNEPHLDPAIHREMSYYLASILKLTGMYLEDQAARTSLGNEIQGIKESLSAQTAKTAYVSTRLADWYAREIFTGRNFKVIIYGDEQVLKAPENLSRIRALLLSALRSCVLWRQMGGTQMNMLFGRSKMAVCARRMLEVL